MKTPPKCLRCQTPMAKGFQVDHTGHGSAVQTKWIEGDPHTSTFLGVNLSGFVKGERDALELPITLYRCPSCGCLESFAHPAPSSSK